MSFPIKKQFESLNINIESKNTIDNFTIKSTPAVKYIFLFLFSLFLILTIIGVISLFNEPIKDVLELIEYLFLIFLLPGLFLLFYIYYDKKRYIIADGKITYHRFLKKDLVLNLKDIIYYKMEKSSSNSYPIFVFYTKEGRGMPILNNPVVLTNIYLLKELIEKNGWEKRK